MMSNSTDASNNSSASVFSVEQIQTLIEDYSNEPTQQKLEDILVLIAAFDSDIQQQPLLQKLLEYKKFHGLTLPMLRKSVREFATEGLESFFKTGFSPLAVCRTLESQDHFITLPTDGKLRRYDSGAYRVDASEKTQRDIHNLLGDSCRSYQVNEVISILKTRTMQDLPPTGDYPCLHDDFINLSNGIVEISTGHFQPHSPDFLSTIQLPVIFDSGAKCPEIEAFLFDVLEGREDDIELAYQLIGYSMLQSVPLGKIAVLYGPTHTGKSTFLDILVAFLGSENVSGQSLQNLDDETMRFSRSKLYGKLANISGDLSARHLSGDSNIKKIASGDAFDVELKGRDPFTIRPFATLFSACNTMPTSNDRSDAWYERIIIIEFLRQHTGKNAKRGYKKQLTTPSELSRLFNKALRALQGLLANGVFIETQRTRQALADYKIENDHVTRFIEETFVKQPPTDEKMDRFPEDEVYKLYKAWVDIEGISRPVSKSKFRQTMTTWLEGNRKRVRHPDGSRPFVWEGLIPISDDILKSLTHGIPL